MIPFPIPFPAPAPAPPGTPPWVWIVLALIGCLGPMATLLAKMYQDGIFRRELRAKLDAQAAKLDAQAAEMTRLRSKDDEQEEEIVRLRERAARLEAGQEAERRAKHWYRNKLNAAAHVITLYRLTHGQHQLDRFDWSPEQHPPGESGDVQTSVPPAPPVGIDTEIANRGD